MSVIRIHTAPQHSKTNHCR